MRATFSDQDGFELTGLHLTRAAGRARGWIARRPARGLEALLLSPCSSVHFWGVSRRLDVLFLAASGAVLRHHRHVVPGSMPLWFSGAWAVFEAASERCPENWQPKAVSWRYTPR